MKWLLQFYNNFFDRKAAADLGWNKTSIPHSRRSVIL